MSAETLKAAWWVSLLSMEATREATDVSVTLKLIRIVAVSASPPRKASGVISVATTRWCRRISCWISVVPPRFFCSFSEPCLTDICLITVLGVHCFPRPATSKAAAYLQAAALHQQLPGLPLVGLLGAGCALPPCSALSVMSLCSPLLLFHILVCICWD